MALILFLLSLAAVVIAQCPDYSKFSQKIHEPVSSGRYALSYQRPEMACRTFNSSIVETTIDSMQGVIKDPDMFRLFQNSYPNSLDTAVKWKGFADGTDEELTFLITGDINAMWLRDSANQMQSYLPLLTADSSLDSLASLYRGVINLQARYILTSPHCNSFQAPAESGLPPERNGGDFNTSDTVFPKVSNQTVFECKYELDSLAAFLEISTNYYEATNDTEFFKKYNWTTAVRSVLNVTKALQIGTYAENGTVNADPYTFVRETTVGTDTEINSGAGSPVQSGTGLVRSHFRPSDDVCIYQLFIPANMMFSRFLASASKIASAICEESLAEEMSCFATSIRTAISQHGLLHHPKYGKMYAYEVDGFASQNLMDDANIPSLLSAPLFGYLPVNDTYYQNTRSFVLSSDNPYYMRGSVISAVGGPHDGPGKAWPMAAIVRFLTSTNQTEVVEQLKMIVSSTAGLGLIHESIDTFNATAYTRQWFSWANGLFGQALLTLNETMPEVLALSYQ